MQCSGSAEDRLMSAVPPLLIMATRRRNLLPTVPTKSMALFIISFPLMVLAVALAVLPLLLVSHGDHRRRTAETIPDRHGTPSEPVTAVDSETVLLAA